MMMNFRRFLGGAIADKFDGIQEDSDDDLILDLDTPIP